MAPASHTVIGFLNLPFEIRVSIYHHVFDDSVIEMPLQTSHTNSRPLVIATKAHLPLLRTCGAIREEALPIFFELVRLVRPFDARNQLITTSSFVRNDKWGIHPAYLNNLKHVKLPREIFNDSVRKMLPALRSVEIGDIKGAVKSTWGCVEMYLGVSGRPSSPAAIRKAIRKTKSRYSDFVGQDSNFLQDAGRGSKISMGTSMAFHHPNGRISDLVVSFVRMLRVQN